MPLNDNSGQNSLAAVYEGGIDDHESSGYPAKDSGDLDHKDQDYSYPEVGDRLAGWGLPRRPAYSRVPTRDLGAHSLILSADRAKPCHDTGKSGPATFARFTCPAPCDAFHHRLAWNKARPERSAIRHRSFAPRHPLR